MNCPDCNGTLSYISSDSWTDDDGITRILMITKYYKCENCGAEFEQTERSATQYDDTPEFYDYD